MLYSFKYRPSIDIFKCGMNYCIVVKFNILISQFYLAAFETCLGSLTFWLVLFCGLILFKPGGHHRSR